jgi:hypothetical protein
VRSQRRPKWESHHLGTIDLDTGEVTPGVTVQVPVRYRVGDHMATLQEAARAVALDREITPTALRVLKYLESFLDYENAIRVVQSRVADELGFDRADVNRAFKVLLKKGVIERVEAPSLKSVYRLNPNYGWRGGHGKWAEARKNAPPLRLLKTASVTEIPT